LRAARRFLPRLPTLRIVHAASADHHVKLYIFLGNLLSAPRSSRIADDNRGPIPAGFAD
jgi:hypothetical protein